MATAARYDDLGRGKGFFRKSADAAYTAGKSSIDSNINRVADELIDVIKANISAITPSSPSDETTLSRYSQSLTRVDEGENFARRKVFKGSTIRVALVAPVGGAASAMAVEYSMGGNNGEYPMTKAVFEMGGSI